MVAGRQGRPFSQTRWLAERRNAEAQYNLGVMYLNGHGVQQSYVETMNWFRRAVDRGLAVAQYNLGILYANAYGVLNDDKTILRR
jgi:uncharacterized protein